MATQLSNRLPAVAHVLPGIVVSGCVLAPAPGPARQGHRQGDAEGDRSGGRAARYAGIHFHTEDQEVLDRNRGWGVLRQDSAGGEPVIMMFKSLGRLA